MTSEETYAEAVQDATAKLRDINAQVRSLRGVPHSCPVGDHEACVRRIVREELDDERARTGFKVLLAIALGAVLAIALQDKEGAK